MSDTGEAELDRVIRKQARTGPTLGDGSQETADPPEALARAEGDAAGLREALRVAEAASLEARRREEDMARRLNSAEERAIAADHRADEALAIMRGLVERVEQIQQDRAAEAVEVAAERARLAAAQDRAGDVERAAAEAIAAAEAKAREAIGQAEEADRRSKEAERQAEAATARLDSLQQERLKQLREAADAVRATREAVQQPLWRRLIRRA